MFVAFLLFVCLAVLLILSSVTKISILGHLCLLKVSVPPPHFLTRDLPSETTSASSQDKRGSSSHPQQMRGSVWSDPSSSSTLQRVEDERGPVQPSPDYESSLLRRDYSEDSKIRRAQVFRREAADRAARRRGDATCAPDGSRGHATFAPDGSEYRRFPADIDPAVRVVCSQDKFYFFSVEFDRLMDQLGLYLIPNDRMDPEGLGCAAAVAAVAAVAAG